MLSSGVLPKKGGLYSGARQWGSKLEQLETVVAKEESSGVERRGIGTRKTTDLLRALLRTIPGITQWPFSLC